MRFPKITQLLSPNKGMTPRTQRTAVVLHHTCGTWEGTTAWIINPASKVSYHAIINFDGEIREFVPSTLDAWHAGRSAWRGREHCNTFTLGIAFNGDTVTGERRPHKHLTPQEVSATVAWIDRLSEIYGKMEIITHAMVAPGRKNDTSPRARFQVLEALKG